MDHSLVYLGICFMATWQESAFCLGWSILQMLMRTFLLMSLFSASLCLLFSCLVVLSVERGVLKSLSIIFNVSIFPSSSIKYSFMYFETPLFSVYPFWFVVVSWWMDRFLLPLYNSSFSLVFFALKSTFYNINIATPKKLVFPPFYIQTTM